MTLTTQPGYQILPYECHEGNLGLEDILSAARAYDRAVDEAVRNGQPMPPSIWLDPPAGQAATCTDRSRIMLALVLNVCRWSNGETTRGASSSVRQRPTTSGQDISVSLITPVVARWIQDGLRDPDAFWARAADELPWFRRWDRVFEWDPPTFRWFIGAETNLAYNALDHHVAHGTAATPR